MEQPLVSVICLCFNHARFVREAVKSVIDQSYKNIQIILVDDASTDDSVIEIRRISEDYPFLEVLMLEYNVGNCKAFNRTLKLVRGSFVIDFATDDIMMPDRIQNQVNFFKSQDSTLGVVFTDATYINQDGEFLRNHFEYLFRKGLISAISQGDVFRSVLSTYFIPSPTMMIRKEVLDKLDGYDEALAYEDFDFWVRSSRLFKYGFLNETLTAIRRTGKSMSSGWYRAGDKQLHSTYLVCRKAMGLCRDEMDVQALLIRIRYELRQSVFSENNKEVVLFFGLIKELNQVTRSDTFLQKISFLKLPIRWLRKIYHLIRF